MKSVMMRCILTAANEQSKKFVDFLMKRRLCLRNPHRFNINYVVYGNIYNRVTKWLYVIDEELTDGLKKIRVVLRKLKRKIIMYLARFQFDFNFFLWGKRDLQTFTGARFL
jgi:hypothetical protein